ncbi:MAG: hypothetical protein ORN50_06575, partial [Crocinitomicaceae bacterium]|nr:hypothetical protein [Crocinitomicaceae bacterium]
MLLLITNSSDGTGNLLVDKFQKDIFRFNYDLFNDYRFELKPDFWQITNPAGLTISSKTVTSCFWWKAFNAELENQDNYVVQEVKYLFRELYNWCRLNKLVKGNSFEFHNQYGKNTLLNIAEKYFKTPNTLITLNFEGIEKFSNDRVVVKSLSSALTNNKASLLTTEVDIKKLDSKFPWYIQEKITSDFDVTIFVCNSRIFAYERSRKNLKGLDWRGEQSFEPGVKEWFNLDLTNSEQNSINEFCNDINVKWG